MFSDLEFASINDVISHVSVGIGDFDLVVFSYGHNSPNSLSSTRARWQYGLPDLTEREAMEWVDRGGGKRTPPPRVPR